MLSFYGSRQLWPLASIIGYGRFMILSSRLKGRRHPRWLIAIELCAMALAACSDNSEQTKQAKENEAASQQAIAKERALFASADTAIAEFRKQISAKVLPQSGGVYVKDVGVLSERFFLSRNSTWRVQCGPLGFSVIFQPNSAAPNDDVDLKLTWVSFSGELCDATVPAIGAYVASLVAKSN